MKWKMEPVNDDDGTGYCLIRNDIAILVVLGPKRDWRESYLKELLADANRVIPADVSGAGDGKC